MITTVKSLWRDHPSEWSRDFVSAPSFDITAYQERLDAICGKSRGQSIMKLEWGGNTTVTKHDAWDDYGNPTHTQILPRFAIPRRNAILDFTEYIPIRRWVISERREPEQHRPDDDSDNTFTDEYGIVCKAADKDHEAHLYLPYIYVGDHSNCPDDCCSTKLCLGDYKAPGVDELDYLLEVTYKLQAEFDGDPYKPLNDIQVAEFTKEYNEKQEAKRQADQLEFDAESKDIYKTIKHHLEDNNFKQPIYITRKGEHL